MVIISRTRTEHAGLSIRWRILLTNLLIVGASFAVMASLLTNLMASTLISQRTRQDSLSTERLAESVAPFLAVSDVEALDELLLSAAAGTDDRIMLCDGAGRVQIDTLRMREGTRLEVAEVASVLRTGSASAGFHLAEDDAMPSSAYAASRYADMAAAPVVRDDELIGVLVLISPVDEIVESMSAVQRRMLRVFLAVAAAASVAALIVSHVLTRPLALLKRTIQKMTRGDLSARVDVRRAGGGEMRALAKSYNAMAEQLEQLDQSRNQFVSNASHELKTPLATMKILLETMIYEPNMPADTRQEFMNDMNHEIDRLTSVITDLLTLTRMDNDNAKIKIEACDISELTEETVHSLRPVAEKRDQKLSAELEPGITVFGDASKLGQVFYNLIENAIKYTPDGGHIRIALAKRGKNAVWSVRDDGVGISEKDQSHIFERFYRVDKARSRETGGTGLGLSIVREMVKLHGGEIAVSSKPGEGSLFTVTLPMDARREAGR